MAYNDLSNIRALNGANLVYENKIRKLDPAKAEEKKAIADFNEKIERNKRVIDVLEFCLKHKAEANKFRKRGSLVRLRGVPD